MSDTADITAAPRRTVIDGATLAGNTTGSFASGPGTGNFPIAQGVIGNFDLSGTHPSGDIYNATGIYAGSTAAGLIP